MIDDLKNYTDQNRESFEQYSLDVDASWLEIEEQLEKVADQALDWCETAIEKSDTEYDNMIVLPLIKIIREAYGIEDNY